MDAKRISLEHYADAQPSFHIHRVSGDCEAQQLHVHDYFQIYYVMKGSITHVLDEAQTTLVRGDVFIIPPERSHRIVMGDRDAVFYSVSFTGGFLSDLGFGATYPGKFLAYLQSAGDAVRPRIAIPADDQIFLEMTMDTLMREFAERRQGSVSMIQGLMTAILTLFGRTYFENAQEAPDAAFENNRQSMLYCIEYIRNNRTQNITLPQIVRMGAMSRSNFCRLFKRLMHMSFREYLNKLRIDRAMELLCHSSHSADEIATLCGYGDYSTFYRNFVRFTQTAPTDVKRIASPFRCDSLSQVIPSSRQQAVRIAAQSLSLS